MAQIGEVPGGGLPWGGIVKVQTPFTDQVTANLLSQQQDRRKFQQETTIKADEVMNKELANVRSADMETVMDGYGKWKNIAMEMLNPKVQADLRQYNQLQVQKNAALGQTMAAINRSSQLNQQAKELVGEYKAKAPLFADDFGERLAALNNTPMDQLQAHPKYGDLTNYDTFRHKGGQTNFYDMEGKAAGKPIPVAGAEKVEKISDLQTRRTPTEFGSTPGQFFENLRGQLAQHIPGRDAAAAWEAIPEQQRAAVDQQFAAISPEKWLAMTGTAKPQVIAPADPNNGAENYAAYRAKVYAINGTPRPGTPKVETNEEAKLNLQFDQKELYEDLRQGHREALQQKGFKFWQMKQDARDQVMNGVVQQMLEKAKAGKPIEYKVGGGGVQRQYEIPASTILRKEFAVPDDKGHPILVDAFRLSEDGQSVTPIFLKPGQTGTMKAVDRDISQPMTIGEFKARASKAMFGVKESARETGKPTGTTTTTTKSSSGITWK